MAAANHLILLVEEPSMEAFLRELLGRELPAGVQLDIHPFQGKSDLLAKLEARLRAYAQWLPDESRLLVIVDRDDDDCHDLKTRMEASSQRAGLLTRARVAAGEGACWQIANRIAVEELEAWYFGDWAAVQAAYPRLPDNVPRRRSFRDPDAITGGTWEAFERVLQRYGYAKGGLAKIETARTIGRHADSLRNCSTSFRALHAALVDALS